MYVFWDFSNFTIIRTPFLFTLFCFIFGKNTYFFSLQLFLFYFLIRATTTEWNGFIF